MADPKLSELDDLIHALLREGLIARYDAYSDAALWGAGFYGDPPTKVTLVGGEVMYESAPSSIEERDAAIALRRPRELKGLSDLL